MAVLSAVTSVSRRAMPRSAAHSASAALSIPPMPPRRSPRRATVPSPKAAGTKATGPAAAAPRPLLLVASPEPPARGGAPARVAGEAEGPGRRAGPKRRAPPPPRGKRPTAVARAGGGGTAPALDVGAPGFGEGPAAGLNGPGRAGDGSADLRH